MVRGYKWRGNFFQQYQSDSFLGRGGGNGDVSLMSVLWGNGLEGNLASV